jgi:hypothetical protein
VCLEPGLACPVLSSRLESAFRLTVVAELALQRLLAAFSGGPFRGIKPIRSFDEFTVSADDPIKMPSSPFTGRDGQGIGYVALSSLMPDCGMKQPPKPSLATLPPGRQSFSLRQNTA